jgi:hypothetical protein
MARNLLDKVGRQIFPVNLHNFKEYSMGIEEIIQQQGIRHSKLNVPIRNITLEEKPADFPKKMGIL